MTLRPKNFPQARPFPQSSLATSNGWAVSSLPATGESRNGSAIGKTVFESHRLGMIGLNSIHGIEMHPCGGPLLSIQKHFC